MRATLAIMTVVLLPHIGICGATFPDYFDPPPLDTADLWKNIQNVKAFGNKLMMIAANKRVGSLDILTLPSGESAKKITLTATGVDLSSGGQSLRSVAFRVSNANALIVHAVLAASRDERTGADRVSYVLAKTGSENQVLKGEFTGAALTGTFILRIDNNDAELEYNSVKKPKLPITTGDDITECRVELQADGSLGGNPTIDSFDATR